MDIEEAWTKALKGTEIIRARVQALLSLSATHVPYVLLSESSVNMGDTVVRKGEIVVEKPSLIIPPNNPQFLGFEFEGAEGFDQNSLINFLIVRGVTIPSLRYDNRTGTLDIYEDKLSAAIKHYKELLQRQEDVQTGLLAGPEDCWQFSLLIFICTQIARNVDQDIRKLLDGYHKKNGN
ncbi:MAG: hypothetical protein A3D87_08445 [Omnitrophica WOR_2 bacterium RIFCSPHIGHO2_02_FULL_50_17]|nr:MAG: hypothetical protein A3D87_08445 [Omnitrophica WOR_2 bacterium RIFCSPHIGHO2_02_FULL_50_17]